MGIVPLHCSAPARFLRLLRVHLVALCSSAPQGGPQPPASQPRARPQLLELAASKVAHFTVCVHPGAGLAWREAAVEQAVFSVLKKKQAEPRGGLVAFGRRIWRRCRTLEVGQTTIRIKMAVETTSKAA